QRAREHALSLRVANRLSLARLVTRQRDAAAALARDHPIGSRFDCARDAIFAPLWNPFHFFVNGIERSATQLIDANEELFDIAEDDRGFGTPTVWIGVMKLLFAEQHATLAQQA